MKLQLRLRYARKVCDWAYEEFDNWEENNVGADLAYLLSALIAPRGEWVDWRYPEDEEEYYRAKHPFWFLAQDTRWFKALNDAGIVAT